MHDGLRDLRANAADDAVRAHQARGGDRLQQMLRDQRVDRRHAGDVDDRDGRAGADDGLQQALHHHLRAGAIERADERQCKDARPQLDDRRRQLQQLLLLAVDDFFAALLIDLGREERELVENEWSCSTARRRASQRRVRELIAQPREQRLLQRENERRRFRRRKPCSARANARRRARKSRTQPTHRWLSENGAPLLSAVPEQRDELTRLLAQLAFLHQIRAQRRGGKLQLDPFGEHFLLVGERPIERGSGRRHKRRISADGMYEGLSARPFFGIARE